MTKVCIAAALIACWAVPAWAQSAQEPPPVADKGLTSQINCVGEDDMTLGDYGHYLRQIKLTNKCEQRLKCEVFSAAFGAQGLQKGHNVMILAPKSRGAAATKTYQYKIKEGGGMLTTSRYCRVF